MLSTFFQNLFQSHTIQSVVAFDQTYKGWMETIRVDWLNSLMLAITHIGDPAVLLLVTVCILFFLWLRKKSLEVIVFASAMAGAAALVWILKHVVARARPLGGVIVEDGYSFPSGHALVASVFFPLVIYFFKAHVPKPRFRYVIVTCMVLVMVTVVLSRPYLGVHYISDALVGMCLGLIISAGTVLVTEAYRRKYNLD
jgi:undecaprenyl-diphosphatase